MMMDFVCYYGMVLVRFYGQSQTGLDEWREDKEGPSLKIRMKKDNNDMPAKIWSILDSDIIGWSWKKIGT